MSKETIKSLAVGAECYRYHLFTNLLGDPLHEHPRQ